jgi:acyl carrier protein
MNDHNLLEPSIVEQRVVGVVREVLKVAADEVTSQTRFVEDLGADSLDRITLMLALEDEFGTSVPDDEDSNLTTVGAVVELIIAQANKRG